MIQDSKNTKHFTADNGKVFRRLSDKLILGQELYLGAVYYLGSIKLYEPLTEIIEHYEEIDNETEQSYGNDYVEYVGDNLFVNGIYMGAPKSPCFNDLKASIVSTKYSYDDQLAILCNMGDGDEVSRLKYLEMQGWRQYASQTAKTVEKIINEYEDSSSTR